MTGPEYAHELDRLRDDDRVRRWLDDSRPVLAQTPGTPACDGSCSALGMPELVTLARIGCRVCGQPPVAPGGTT